MYDITLINSQGSFSIKGWKPSVPLGILYLTAVLEESGYSVEVKDYQMAPYPDDISVDSFLNYMRSCRSNVIGISVMCTMLPTVLLAITRLKETHPEKKIILGGPAATDTPDQILAKFPVDIIVKGEGEETIIELMEALEKDETKLTKIPGISFRNSDGKIQSQPFRCRITNLDKLPFPAYDKIDLRKYGHGAVITSRGCPFKCAFCDAPYIWGGTKVTYRSIDNVIEEIRLLRDHCDYISIYDDTFFLKKDRILEFCSKMKTESIDRPWTCNGRVDLLSDDLLQRMSQSGCTTIFFGIESGSDSILRTINKGFTTSLARQAIEKASKFLGVITSFIYGYPFETMDDFYQTVFFLTKIVNEKKVKTQIGMLSPLPRSPIYQKYKDQISFSEELIPEMVLPYKCGGTVPSFNLLEQKDIIEAVQKNPEIFLAFYHYASKMLPVKRKIVDNIRNAYGGTQLVE